jgi:hypothetical protein
MDKVQKNNLTHVMHHDKKREISGSHDSEYEV